MVTAAALAAVSADFFVSAMDGAAEEARPVVPVPVPDCVCGSAPDCAAACRMACCAALVAACAAAWDLARLPAIFFMVFAVCVASTFCSATRKAWVARAVLVESMLAWRTW